MFIATIMGNLVEDAKTGELKNGTCFTKMRIAARTSSKNEDGEYVTMFIDARAWGQSATRSASLKKGCKVLINGDYGERTWVGRDGKTHITCEMNVNQLEIFDRPAQQSTESADKKTNTQGFVPVQNADGLPF